MWRAAEAGLGRAAWAGAAVVFTILFVALLRAPGVPLVARLLFILPAVLSAVNPDAALLLFAGLSPLAAMLVALGAAPLSGTAVAEGLAVATVAPWFIARAWRPGRPDGPDARVAAPAFLYAVIVVASAAVELPVVALQVGGARAFAPVFWQFLSRDYFLGSVPFRPLAAALVTAEAAALLVMVNARARRGLASRLLTMMLAGAAAAGALNLYRLVAAALRSGAFWPRLARLSVMGRISIHYDRNAAGSYFAMMFVAAMGLPTSSRRRKGLVAGSIAIVGAALWLTGSRAALAAAAIAAALFAAVLARRTMTPSTRRRAGLGALAIVVLAAAVAVWYPRQRNPTVGASIRGRRELAIAAVRMFTAHPVFGVGVSRFYDLSTDYGRPALLDVLPASNPRENAHNNFLQVLAETGAVGLAALLWLLAAAMVPAWGARDRRLPNALFWGAAAFVATWLTGHPLLVPEAMYPFFVLLGLSSASTPARAATASPPRRLDRRVALAGAVVLAALLAPRLHGAALNADLEHVGYGVSAWRRDAAVGLYRWAGLHSTFFVASDAGVADIPLKRAPDAGPITVAIALDGRPANRVRLADDDWHDVRLVVPRARARFRRLDLTVLGRSADNPDDASAAEPSALMVGKIRTPR